MGSSTYCRVEIDLTLSRSFAVIPAQAGPAPQLMRGIQVSSTGSLFSQGQAWIPVFTGMTTLMLFCSDAHGRIETRSGSPAPVSF